MEANEEKPEPQPQPKQPEALVITITIEPNGKATVAGGADLVERKQVLQAALDGLNAQYIASLVMNQFLGQAARKAAEINRPTPGEVAKLGKGGLVTL